MALQWPYSRQRAIYLGDPFSLADLKDFTNNFKSEVKVDLAKQQDSLASKFLIDGEIRNGEFFGIETINQLINLAKEKNKTLSGIKVYYGLAYETLDKETGESKISTKPIEGAKDSVMRPHLFLVAVDDNGKDIEIDFTSFKDAPDGNGVGNGSPQPPFGNG